MPSNQTRDTRFSHDSTPSLYAGKPHPRWADPNYYEGDASDKWHTRSAKRLGANKQRRPQSPGQNGNGPTSGISVKTEPVNDMQHSAYYRLSPSPPPNSAVSTTLAYGVNTVQTNHFSSGFDGTVAASGGTGNACSPVSYSPSSPADYGDSASSSSSGMNGAYHFSPDARKLCTRPHFPSTDTTPRDTFRYDEQCGCTSNPTSGHTFSTIARQLDAISNYLQQLPEHSQSQKCGIFRRIQELRSILQ